jgi:hypothetical protein
MSSVVWRLRLWLRTIPTTRRDPASWFCNTDETKQPIHVVWGIPAGQTSPAVVVTAYRPDPMKWDETWQRRRT